MDQRPPRTGIRRRAARPPVPGRPLGPQLAWAALAALSADGGVEDVRAHVGRNLRHRLNALLQVPPPPEGWRMLLRARADRQRFWAYPAMVADLVDDPRVSLAEARAAGRSGLNISAGDDVVVDARDDDVPALGEHYALEDDPHGAVELCAVPAAAGRFAPQGGSPVPLAAAVLDMLDADDSRKQQAACGWLEQASARVRHEAAPSHGPRPR